MFGSQVEPVIPTIEEQKILDKERQVREIYREKGQLDIWKRCSPMREDRLHNAAGHLRNARKGECEIDFIGFDDDTARNYSKRSPI